MKKCQKHCQYFSTFFIPQSSWTRCHKLLVAAGKVPGPGQGVHLHSCVLCYSIGCNTVSGGIGKKKERLSGWNPRAPATSTFFRNMPGTPTPHIQGKTMNKNLSQNMAKFLERKQRKSTVFGHIPVHIFALYVGVGVPKRFPSFSTSNIAKKCQIHFRHFA